MYQHNSSSLYQLDHLVICISSLLIIQVIFIFNSSSVFESGSYLDLDHHGTSSLDLDHLLIWINITGSVSSLDLDHHHWTGSGSSLDLDQHWCYLMILLVIGSSTELSFFHAGCRPSHQVNLRPALTSDLLIRKACPPLTSDLLVRKACLALTFDHVGTNPIITSERPNTHIHQHDRTQYYHL